MKVNELFEEIHCGTIKDDTKINVVNELTGDTLTTIEYKNGMLKWKPGEFDTSFLCNIDIDFFIEENNEILELRNPDKWKANDKDIVNIVKTINELVREVNKLRKEREEK